MPIEHLRDNYCLTKRTLKFRLFLHSHDHSFLHGQIIKIRIEIKPALFACTYRVGCTFTYTHTYTHAIHKNAPRTYAIRNDLDVDGQLSGERPGRDSRPSEATITLFDVSD